MLVEPVNHLDVCRVQRDFLVEKSSQNYLLPTNSTKFEIVKKFPKYSIILPVKNGMPYLEYSIRSILADQFEDVELIVSVAHGDLTSMEFLNGLRDKRLILTKAPSSSTGMVDDWNFAQTYASGTWQMFLGQDDLLAKSFPEILERVTDYAVEKSVRAIVARRAYVAWPPLGDDGLKPLQYWRTEELKEVDSFEFTKSALNSGISYHAGPQMYTSSLVEKSLIEEIKNGQGGRLIMGHPQDAFLAASVLKFSSKFIYSGTPFSWVGTSTRSAGLSITSPNPDQGQLELANEYFESVKKSDGVRVSKPEDFFHGVDAKYFYEALTKTGSEVLERLRASSPLFMFFMDVNFLASYSRGQRTSVDSRNIVSSQKLLFAKLLTSYILRGARKSAHFAQRALVALHPSFFNKKFNYRAVSSVSSPEELFKNAMSGIGSDEK